MTENLNYISRISRIPARCSQDIKIILLLRNWYNILTAKLNRAPLNNVSFRNGVVLKAPEHIDLAFLFHEIWVKELYSPRGYDIGKDDVVVDIGANIGVFATFAATRAPGVKVYAYEPFPANVFWLRKNAAESNLDNINIYELAVAGMPGTRTLQVNDQWITHSLYEASTKNQGLAVNCTTLDSIINEVGRCDLLKLDCEGSEYEILSNSLPETLRRVKRIVGEYHEGPGFPGTGLELCRLLESKGFKISTMSPFEIGGGFICATNEESRQGSLLTPDP